MSNKFKIIDSHAHYDDESFDDDRAEVLKQITENGVIGIMNCACSCESLKTTDKLTKEYEYIYGALGIHPENAYELNQETLDEIKDYISKNDKIVAIGEIGLDYHYEDTDKKKQQIVFKRQLDIASKYNKPVIIHCRDAIQDTYNILSNYHLSGSLHCFSGSLEMALEFIKLGYLIGIGGVCTFKNSKNIKNVIENIDLEYIVLETDSPYLTPEPFRMEKNSSKNIPIIAKKIAEIKDTDVNKVAKITTENADRCFFR